MEDTNVINQSVPVENVAGKKPKSKKTLVLLIVGIVLAVLVLAVLIYAYIKKESPLTLINNAIVSVDTMLEDTGNLDGDLTDLPENLLDSDAVSEDDIDNSLTDLENQLDMVGGLDEDFDLDASDVGL